jgi:peptidoglycan/LPS O-acetylase OafA/YrhL
MMNYRREIDGLRAIAVLPVIWFHSGFSGLPGGFLGVDVFFVISGFLITSILLREIDEGSFSMIGFYERRARRILPALFLVVLATIPFAWIWMYPSTFADYSRSIGAIVLFISNVHFWETAGYFGVEAIQKPLLHTWSLAVEEQYYLIFPWLLVLMRRGGWRLKVIALSVLAALSLMLSEWGWRNEPDVNFYFTFSRFWELLAGSIAAVFAFHHPPQKNGMLGLTGLLLILGAMVGFSAATPVPSVYALIPVIGSVLVLLYAQADTLVARLLSLRLIVGIGLVSYSAYLWHHPLFSFAHIATPNGQHPALMVFLMVLTFALATASWRYVEQPFRRKNNRVLPRRGPLFAASAAACLAFFSFGYFGDQQDGFAWRFFTPAQLAIVESQRDGRHPDVGVVDCFLDPDIGTVSLAPACIQAERNVLLWGDSHAATLSTGLRDATTLSQLSASGCPPVLSFADKKRAFCTDMIAEVLETVSRANPRKIVLHANWLRYDMDTLSGFGDTLDQLKTAAPEADILVVGGTPQWAPNLPEQLADVSDPLARSHRLPAQALQAVQARDAHISSVAARHGVPFVSLVEVLCGTEDCVATVPDPDQGGFTSLIWDYGHLSSAGSKYVVREILRPLLKD